MVKERAHEKTNALAYIRTHALAHKCEHTCHVMCGVPWGPDEWNLSVGSRYTEHHGGSLSSQKSTKPQSRSGRLHHKYRHRDTYAAMCAHAPGHIQGQAGNTQKAKKRNKKKKNRTMHIFFFGSSGACGSLLRQQQDAVSLTAEFLPGTFFFLTIRSSATNHEAEQLD